MSKPDGNGTIRKKGGLAGRLAIAAAILLFTFVFFVSIDNFRIVWDPREWLDETAYLLNLEPTKVPAAFPALSAEAAALVDPRLHLAFHLIQRDPEFGYLADYAVANRIKIAVSSEDMAKYCRSDKACYDNVAHKCSKSASPGVIYMSPKFAAGGTAYFIAGVLVHELTHAQNRLEKPEYYCLGPEERYLSDEFTAFKNQLSFERQYGRGVISDYFDRQGDLHPYCLYSSIKSLYADRGLIDDVEMAPASGVERFFCVFHTW